MRQAPLLVSTEHPGCYFVAVQGECVVLQSGMEIQVKAGDAWISGVVEHGPVYAAPAGAASPFQWGYYMSFAHNALLGLCAGMDVRIQEEGR